MSEQAEAMMKKGDQAYITGLMKVLHGPKTTGQVMGILQSAPPEKSIPKAANNVHSQMESAVRAKGKEPSLETRLNAGLYLVADLAEMGNTSGVWEQPVTQETLPNIIEATLQSYIEEAGADGRVDPVELQKIVEPMMTEEHKAKGLQAAELGGIPREANEMTAMEEYASKKVRKAESSIASKMAGKNTQGALQRGQA